MDNLIPRIPEPKNEPVGSYLPGSAETKALKSQLTAFLSQRVDIPVIINGKEIRTGKMGTLTVPHAHSHVLGTYHKAGPEEVQSAIQGSLQAHREWSRTSFLERSAVFLKAAELLATKYRPILNASTMLGQSKTCYQAEIDSACELIDFYRFNVHFMQQLSEMQPISTSNSWNRLQYRPLEGFVFAITPFNFTSIGGNLPTSPAMLGNVCLWKPASTSVYSNYFIMKLLEEAGLPPGVIQFLPGDGASVGDPVLASEHLAGIHFTGSTSTFQSIWTTVGQKIAHYRTYPRIVGETGGKDFIFAHPSAETDSLATAMVRGSFEYQGQKCSASSRAYIPKSLWGKVSDRLVSDLKTVKMGEVTDFRNFMSAVIDKKSFERIRQYIEEAKRSQDVRVVFGGGSNEEVGYFIEPTVFEVKDPYYRTMQEEIFGPVLSVYVYDDHKLDETLKLCDETSPYALTGAVFARDRQAVEKISSRLTNSAGNFYVNNKPTGAVVGQQPFGGARASGTNDKAGSLFNLMRWVSLRTVSETFVPPTDYRYPFMGE